MASALLRCFGGLNSFKAAKEPQFENKCQRKDAKKSSFDRDSVQKPYQKFLDRGSVEIGSISKRSKIVLIGDPALIDNPYIESGSNGLVFCFNRMIG